MADGYRSSAIDVHNFILTDIQREGVMNGYLLGYCDDTGAIETSTQEWSSEATSQQWGIYGYNLYDGVSENQIETSDVETEQADIAARLLGFTPTDANYDTNFAWYTSLQQLQQKVDSKQDISAYYGDILLTDNMMKVENGAGVEAQNGEIQYLRFDQKQGSIIGFNDYVKALVEGSFVEYFANPADLVEGEAAPSSKGYILDTLYSPSEYLIQSGHDELVEGYGYNMVFVPDETGETDGTFYMHQVEGPNEVSSLQAQYYLNDSATSKHKVYIPDDMFIQMDMAIENIVDTTRIANENRSGWLMSVDEQSKVENLIGEMDNFQITNEAPMLELAKKFHNRDVVEEKLGDIIMTNDGVFTSYVEIPYSNARYEWAIWDAGTYNTNISAPKIFSLNEYDGANREMGEPLQLPAGTFIQMGVISPVVDEDGVIIDYERTDYKYNVPTKGVITEILFSDFRDAENNPYEETIISKLPNETYSFTKMDTVTQVDSITQFTFDEEQEVVIEDQRAAVERFIFVVSFEDATSSALTGHVAVDISRQNDKIQVQRLNQLEDENSDPYDAKFLKKNNVCNSFVELNDPMIHLEQGRTIKVEDNTYRYPAENPDSPVKVSTKENEDWTFARNTPIDISFSVLDQWVSNYDFALDSLNQRLDVTTGAYLSKYMDIHVALEDFITYDEIPLPAGTKVTFYCPDNIENGETVERVIQTVNAMNGYYQFTAGSENPDEDYANAYSFKNVFESNQASGNKVSKMRVRIDFSEAPLFGNAFTESQYNLVITAKRTEDPALPNGETITSVKYPIGLETESDYGLKLDAQGAVSDLMVRDAIDQVNISTTYAGTIVETKEPKLQYFLYKEADSHVVDGTEIYATTYEPASWSELGIKMTDDSFVTGDNVSTHADYLERTLTPTTGKITARNSVVADTITDLTKLDSGNYKIVCRLMVGGSYVAEDFIIFNVNNGLIPQLEIPDRENP